MQSPPLPRLKLFTNRGILGFIQQYQIAAVFERFADLVPRQRLPFLYNHEINYDLCQRTVKRDHQGRKWSLLND